MEQIATNINKKNSRRGTGLGLSAVLMLAISCGSDTAPAPTEPTTTKTSQKDAGTASAKKDASTSTAKKDAGSSAGDDTASDDNAAASGDTSSSKPDTAAIARGKTLATKSNCATCHGKDYSGAGYFPNITPDKDTGVGDWTDEQIADAITMGLDDKGGELCSLMKRYDLSDTEVADMVVYLRSLPAVANEITMECPGS